MVDQIRRLRECASAWSKNESLQNNYEAARTTFQRITADSYQAACESTADYHGGRSNGYGDHVTVKTEEVWDDSQAGPSSRSFDKLLLESPLSDILRIDSSCETNHAPSTVNQTIKNEVNPDNNLTNITSASVASRDDDYVPTEPLVKQEVEDTQSPTSDEKSSKTEGGKRARRATKRPNKYRVDYSDYIDDDDDDFL